MKRYDLEEASVCERAVCDAEVIVKKRRGRKKSGKTTIYPKKNRPWVNLAVEAGVLGLAVLTLFVMKWTGAPVTTAFLNGMQEVVTGNTESDAIRFVSAGGGRKCIIRAPFQRFSADVSGANIRFVGLSPALRPCAPGVVTELGTSGELEFVEVEHADGIRVRYFSGSKFVVQRGESVDKSTLLAPKGAFDPVLLQIYIEGKLCENVSVNANSEIECRL